MSSSRSSSQHHPAPQAEDDEIDLAQLFHTLWFKKWQISVTTALFLAIGTGYALTSTPVYQADAMLEITGSQNQVLGQLNDLIGGSQNEPTDAEVELIKSRLVLGKSVKDLGLDMVLQADKPFYSRLLNDNNIYDVDIADFRVHESWLNQTFTLVAHGEKEFQITTPNKKKYAGVVGQPLNIENGSATITINKINAPFNQAFKLTKFSELNSIERIRQNLSVAPKGKNVPILNLTMTGTNPAQIQDILNRIIANYIDHNRNKGRQTAASGLKFIEDELPKLEDNLREAENNLNAYRAKSGALDMPTEAKGTIDSLNKIEMQMVDLRTEESVLSEVYTPEHPAYKALKDKIKVLEQAKERLNRQISRMPDTQQTIIRLTRDVEINQAIYVQLLNKRQELSILRASSQGNVRLIDKAMTAEKPIKPKKAIIVALSGIVGLMLSAMFFLAKGLLHRGIQSEDDIEAMGLDVLGSIPLSDEQKKKDILFQKTKGKSKKHALSNTLLATQDAADLSIEALRGLRTTLHFRSLDAKNKVIMISGATPEVGKSFVSANLAVLMTQIGHKVLLIDGDMRRSYLNNIVQLPEKHKGLADVLQQEKVGKYTDYIQKVPATDLDFMGIGMEEPKNPSELLLGNRLAELLAWAEKHYDHIILDTPPVLSVTDAAIMGQYAGTSLLVSRFDKTSTAELQACLTRFANNDVQIAGVVLNGISRTAKNYYAYDAYTKPYK